MELGYKKEIVLKPDEAELLNKHLQNKSNPHGVTKEQVGLSDVDNTSDEDKPVSAAVRSEFDKRIVEKNLTSIAEIDTLTANYLGLTKGGSIILKGIIEDQFNSYILFVQGGFKDVITTHQTLILSDCLNRTTALQTRICVSGKWTEWETYSTVENILNYLPNVIDNLESESSTDALSANQGRVLNEKINSYHDKVNDTVVFKYMYSINPNNGLPSVGVDEAGRVYNISEDGASEYLIQAYKVGTILDYSTHTILQLNDVGTKAVAGLKVGDKIDLYDDATGEGFYNVTIGYIDHHELWFDATIEYDDYRNGMLVNLTGKGYIDVKAGDNIVWTGYAWDKLSGNFKVETTDEITEGNTLPVTSDAVYEALGDIEATLDSIIAMQNELMGVSE